MTFDFVTALQSEKPRLSVTALVLGRARALRAFVMGHVRQCWQWIFGTLPGTDRAI